MGTASRVLLLALTAISTLFLARVSAQSPAAAEFDVVSIKRVNELRQGGGMRILPDGTVVMVTRTETIDTRLHAQSQRHATGTFAGAAIIARAAEPLRGLRALHPIRTPSSMMRQTSSPRCKSSWA